MFGRIMRHEWRTLTADATAWVVLVTFAVTIGYSILNGSAAVRRQRQAIQEIARMNQEKIDGVQRKTYELERQIAEGKLDATVPPPYGPRHSLYPAAWAPQKAALPPAPLGVLAVGQSDLFPIAYQIPLYEDMDKAPVTEQTEHPLKLLIGNFDFAFVIVYLYPLLVIALSFNLIASEKEDGTLGILLSQPLRLRTLVLGKLAVRAILIFGGTTIFFIAGLLLSRIDLKAEGMLGALLVCTLLILAYGAFWFCLCLLVNALGRGSAANALILIICWLIFVILLPSSINLLASVLYPVPSRAELVNARRAAESDPQLRRENEESRLRLIEIFFRNHPEFPRDGAYTELGRYHMATAAQFEEVARRAQPIRDRINGQLAKQQAFANLVGIISPATLMQQAFYDLSGTGHIRYRDFLSQVSNYQKVWQRFFWLRIFESAVFTTGDYNYIPRFEYREQSLSCAMKRAILPLIILLSLSLILGLSGLHAYRKYPMVS